MGLACIGVGSNAIRLLFAEWDGTKLINDVRLRRGTRLFAGLVDGRLTKESMDRSVAAIAELTQEAHYHGAEQVYLFATSAVRDAVNGQDFIDAAEDACGEKIDIISGEEEAVLSYLGASGNSSAAVIDIGGGSTEFTYGEGRSILGAVSLQMGAVRMNGQLPILSTADYERTVDLCREIIVAGCDTLRKYPPREEWIGVGGTMTTIGAMEKRIPYFTEAECEGMPVSYELVHRWGTGLSAMPMAQRRTVPGLMPHRADIIPSGLAILDAAMSVFGVESIRLSAHGNMDGYLKEKFKAIR